MKKIERLIKKRINEAKIGVLNIKGNYSILAGDPIALCQNMFGLKVTGILRSGEFYSKYWMNEGVKKIACFRAPMTCHNSALVRDVSYNEDADYWFRYMTTILVFNAWDTSCHASCGSDFDGDTMLTTDNKILIDKHEELPAIMCAQSNAVKVIPTEDDIVESNIRVFGTNVGAITNRGTSRIALMEKFSEGSKEREILAYRVNSCQLLQQECIDSVKNAILQPESKKWYIRKEILNSNMSDDEKKIYLSVCSDKRPYFFRYIYPEINREYTSYLSNTKRKALRLFRKDVDELKAQDANSLTNDEREFLKNYEEYNPVLEYPCVMNNICWAVEKEMDGYISRHKSDYEFDYAIMKSGVGYAEKQFRAIAKLYDQYNARIEDYVKYARKNRVQADEANVHRAVMKEEFKKLCLEKCSSEEVLCDIILDLCYKKERSKAFAWDIVGDQIIKNLLAHNDGKINIPVLDDENGEVEFRGHKYRMETVDYPSGQEEEEEYVYL